MKNTTIFLAALVIMMMLFLLYGATQQDAKIVFVDVNKVTQEYPKMVELNERYKTDVQYYQGKLNEMTKELENMQKSGASQADLEKKQAEILARKQQYEQLIQNEYQPKMQQVLDEIAAKIDKYAKMMGYDYILSKQAFVYGDDAYDITDQLIKYLKAQ
ncbi:MAG TPA: OmpH family outer membrane protein [Pseudothermotoga sp.]|nr:OmpH family outer membrane protein [Pseudothermotoga sp.]HOK83404.1 OmpH family outer membrane protein [Pseudothermotoga sp.]HPP69477.1 OmpH family outer membrane protein [Pseudothermotoga sp.]